MTALQLQYRSLVETQRSNFAKEHETKRHNLVSEDLEKSKLDESARHNLVSEDQNKYQKLKDVGRGIKDAASGLQTVVLLKPTYDKTKMETSRAAAAGLKDVVSSVTSILKLIPGIE